MPSVMLDAVLVPGGALSAEVRLRDGDAVHSSWNLQARQAAVPDREAAGLLRPLGIAAEATGPGIGVILGRNDPATRAQLAQDFIAALARHRFWTRPNAEALPA